MKPEVHPKASDVPDGDKPVGPKVSMPIVIPEEEKEKAHRFWDSQPVPKVSEEISVKCGPLKDGMTVAQVRSEPYQLPPGFEWVTLDVTEAGQMTELYDLLAKHYVEDDDACFRFDYSQDCLKWALTPPGFVKDWHIGVKAGGKLVASISAIPATLKIHNDKLRLAEVNFLCVHTKLRAKRLAPVLIREVTRRVNLTGIWQAVYTAGIFLPRPVADCRYYHRSLNIQKLVAVGFSRLHGRQTMAIAERLYALPTEHKLSGIRKMEASDVEPVKSLLLEYYEHIGSKLYPAFDDEEVAHWLLPRKGVIHSYVREVAGKVTDVFSFYSLPSTVIRYNAQYSVLNAAYNYYCAATSVPLAELLFEALVAAKNEGFDVYNALDLAENRQCFESLKFGPGDGTLKYYLFNWQCPPIAEKDVGLVLL